MRQCIQYYCRMQNETFWLFSVLFQLESSVTSLKYKKHTTLFIVSISSFCSNTLYFSSIEQWSPRSNKSQIPLQNVCCVTTVMVWCCGLQFIFQKKFQWQSYLWLSQPGKTAKTNFSLAQRVTSLLHIFSKYVRLSFTMKNRFPMQI